MERPIRPWTGEAHSVTMGTLADAYAKVMQPYFPALEKQGYQALPQPEPKDVQAVENKIPFMFAGFGPGIQRVAQNGAQPCYLDTGLPPTDKNTPCTKAQQRQPAFTGRQSFYNSGYIHYSGPSGNAFRIKIATDAKPGRYFFFCNNHGPLMSGYLTIKPKGAKIPSQSAVDKAALHEANTALAPLSDVYGEISQRGQPIPAQESGPARVFASEAGLTSSLVEQSGRLFYTGRGAGFGGPPENPSAEGLEFLPKISKVRVGEKVTWVIGNGHTVSFDVPNYFPIFTIRPDGTVVRNPMLDPPAGGSPKLPREDKYGNMVIDAGTWDGRHFLSSGLLNPNGIAAYSLRFGRSGTYKFACLVHPSMVGTITVSP